MSVPVAVVPKAIIDHFDVVPFQIQEIDSPCASKATSAVVPFVSAISTLGVAEPAMMIFN